MAGPPIKEHLLKDGELSFSWIKWFIGLSPGATAVNVTVTVGASPFTYTNASSREQHVAISGGTVSSIGYSNDQSVTVNNTGVIAGLFDLAPGDRLIITHTGAPTMVAAYRV